MIHAPYIIIFLFYCVLTALAAKNPLAKLLVFLIGNSVAQMDKQFTC